ncbi:MAG: CDGSH iron-sulfur domain-containing protein [Polyangiaceae bacterium]|jgi:CDGSH-type Zn-finger protein/ferredoxin
MNKPNETSSDETSAPPIEEARGTDFLLRFEGKRCIHSRQCVLGAPDVFRANVKGPWLDPNAMPAGELAALAQTCPSGAITYERLDGGPAEKAPPVNVARVRENGPIAIHAELHIEGHGTMFRATLCRCGASKNKPFCDGSHVAAGFVASGEPATQPSEPLAIRGGTLTVTPFSGGPLGLRGPIEICSGTGRTVTRTQRTALCRCGASANKPFCDGTHARIDFETE